MTGLTICDVGPRDGLQNLDRTLPVALRMELIERLATSGLPRIEAVQCKENDAPFVGFPNTVGGRAEDQCGPPPSP